MLIIYDIYLSLSLYIYIYIHSLIRIIIKRLKKALADLSKQVRVKTLKDMQ